MWPAAGDDTIFPRFGVQYSGAGSSDFQIWSSAMFVENHQKTALKKALEFLESDELLDNRDALFWASGMKNPIYHESDLFAGGFNPITMLADAISKWIESIFNSDKDNLYLSSLYDTDYRQNNEILTAVASYQVVPYVSVSWGKFGGQLSDNYSLIFTHRGTFVSFGIDYTISDQQLPDFGGGFGVMLGPSKDIPGLNWGATAGAYHIGVETGGDLTGLRLGAPTQYGFNVSTQKYWVGVNSTRTYRIGD
jgi:hypothetical protein